MNATEIGMSCIPTSVRESSQIVVFMGKTGVGKTWTANRLLNETWATGHSAAVTMRPSFKHLRGTDCTELLSASATFVDLMGIGEDRAKDDEYLPTYEAWLRLATDIVWVVQADTRAFKRDEIFLRRLSPCWTRLRRFIVGLNKIDCLGSDELTPAPALWHGPSAAQSEQLPSKLDDVFSLFSEFIGTAVRFQRADVIPYSATTGWGFDTVRSLFFKGQDSPC